jgi:hypothetical protein
MIIPKNVEMIGMIAFYQIREFRHNDKAHLPGLLG